MRLFYQNEINMNLIYPKILALIYEFVSSRLHWLCFGIEVI